MAIRRRRALRALAVATASLLLAAPALVTSAATSVAFTITDQRITGSSGLARDTDRDLYWTVNDSGAEGTVYAVNPDGDVAGIVGFRAQPTDVEAVAMAQSRLYVADIGDGSAKRDFVTVYYFTSPSPDNRTVPYRAYDFRYPDGPHDAETLLVDGDGRLFLVTKEAKGGIYAAPSAPSRQGVNVLERVGDAPAFVTDGVFLPEGDQIALRTYVSVEVLDANSYQPVARAAAPYQKQGESIAVTLDGASLLLGSEGKSSPVLRVAVPTTLAAVPKAAGTPPPSSTPTPKPSTPTIDDAGADDEPAEDATAPPGRAGTVLALSLAGLVALVAAVVVGARR